jgi:hypothetical protein
MFVGCSPAATPIPTHIIVDVYPIGFNLNSFASGGQRDETLYKCLADIGAKISKLPKSAKIWIVALTKESAIESYKVKKYFLAKGFEKIKLKTSKSNQQEFQPENQSKELNSCGT